MTDHQFLRAYHAYLTDNRAQAHADAASVDLDGGGHPVVVGLPFSDGRILYCLMLPDAAALLKPLGIPGDVQRGGETDA